MGIILLLNLTETIPLLAIIFEASSAFGTTGLSVGVTPQLSPFEKLVIALLMFVGRIGILERKAKIHYPKETIIIG